MTQHITPLDQAIKAAGSQQKLAVLCGVSQVAISKARKAGRVSARLAVAIDRATGISREILCPEVFAPRDAGQLK